MGNPSKPAAQPSDRPKWRCWCAAPDNVRSGPGVCQTCHRLPVLVNVHQAYRAGYMGGGG